MATTRNGDSSWTQIKSKSRRSKHPPQPNHLISELHPPRTENLRSTSDIHAEYLLLRKQWESSPCCALLRKIVSSTSSSLSSSSPVAEKGKVRAKWRVSTAVCLGVGSFDPPDGGWEAKRKAYIQLMAFLTMVDELEKLSDNNTKIERIFQEPVFTPNDKAFLTSLGGTHHNYRVVDSPMGFNLVNSDTLLFGVHLYRPIYAMALENGPPAIFVGTGWDVWDSVSLSSEPSNDLKSLQEMERSYDKLAFPKDPSVVTAFSSTSIYFRRTESLSYSHEDGKNQKSKTVYEKAAAAAELLEPMKSDELEQDLVDKLESTKISEIQ